MRGRSAMVVVAAVGLAGWLSSVLIDNHAQMWFDEQIAMPVCNPRMPLKDREVLVWEVPPEPRGLSILARYEYGDDPSDLWAYAAYWEEA